MASDPLWLDDDEQRIWQSLLTVVIALPALLDRQLQRDAGISNFDYGVLARLSLADGATMRLGELARLSDGTLPRLSKVVDRLESRGWVTRRPDPADGRYTLGTLTPSGREALTANAPRHVATVRQVVFEPLSANQQRNLGAALSRIAGTLRTELDAG